MPGPEGPGDQALSGVCRGRPPDFLSRARFALDKEATEVHHQAGHEEGTGDKSHPVEQGDLILAKLKQGLSGQRIFQDLVSDHGFPGGYDSVKRFVRALDKQALGSDLVFGFHHDVFDLLQWFIAPSQFGLPKFVCGPGRGRRC